MRPMDAQWTSCSYYSFQSRRLNSTWKSSRSSRRCSAIAICVSTSRPRPTRAPCTSTLPPGNPMLQTSVARLYEDNREKLTLSWICSKAGGAAIIRQDATESAAFVGHLNLIHPNRIQVLGRHEQAHLNALDVARLE